MSLPAQSLDDTHPEVGGSPPRTRRNLRAHKRLQNEQLGTDPDVLKVLVVTPVPEGVMFELSR